MPKQPSGVKTSKGIKSSVYGGKNGTVILQLLAETFGIRSRPLWA